MAALIAVSALYRSPHSAREITVGGVTRDGPNIRDHFTEPAFDGRSILNWLNPLDLFQPGSSCR